MTVSYQYDVASSSSGGFTRLLFKWKGSVYKLVYRELLWFTFAYTLLSILYRAVLTEDQKRVFEKVVDYFNTFLGLIPLSFVLGVYVTLVVTRWWQQFLAIPWPDKHFEKLVLHCDEVGDMIPLTFILGFYVFFVAGRWWQQFMAIPSTDKLAHCIALYVTGTDEHSRMIRRTIARYLNLSLILVLRSISMAVKKRFPTLQHLVEGGFMTKSELDIYQSVPSSEFNTYWIPCTWVISLIKDARKGKLIVDNQGLKLLVEEFNEFRSKCGLLWSYDWVSIPLVYTQVVTLATYSFFAACVIGRQYVTPIGQDAMDKFIDLYIPIFTFLQFFFYMGLLKVAEALINPFGDDDEDFELNWMIDRHLKVSYLVVDTLLHRVPPLVKDQHFDDPEPTLAYTKAAMMYKKKTFRGSVAAVLVPEDEQTLVLPEIVEEEEDQAEYASDLSINKHSNSIMNLLTWSSSAGAPSRLHHHQKKSSIEEIRARRSVSVTDEHSMEGGRVLPPSGHPHVGELLDRHPHLPTRLPASSPSGIRGKQLPAAFFGSAESVHKKTPALVGRSTSSAAAIGPGGGGRSASVFRGDSFRSEPGVELIIGHHDDDPGESALAAAARLKSHSLDMGHVATLTHEDELAVASVAPPPKVKPRSLMPARLRDLKRKNKKQQQQQRQSPPRGRHRFWRSKESLPSSVGIEEGIELDEGATVAASVAAIPGLTAAPSTVGLGSPISLSLPSLHLGGTCDSERRGSTGSEDEDDDDDSDASLATGSAGGTTESVPTGGRGSGSVAVDSGSAKSVVTPEMTSAATLTSEKYPPTPQRPPRPPSRPAVQHQAGSDNGVGGGGGSSSGKPLKTRGETSGSKRLKAQKNVRDGDNQEHLV